MSLSISTSTTHNIFVSNWNTSAYTRVKSWDGSSDSWFTIDALPTATLGDNDYHYYTTTSGNLYIKGYPDVDSWWSSESHIEPATGWDYFVKFTAENGTNLSSFYGFPAVIITKD